MIIDELINEFINLHLPGLSRLTAPTIEQLEWLSYIFNKKCNKNLTTIKKIVPGFFPQEIIIIWISSLFNSIDFSIRLKDQKGTLIVQSPLNMMYIPIDLNNDVDWQIIENNIKKIELIINKTSKYKKK